MGAKTDLTHACQQVAKKPQHMKMCCLAYENEPSSGAGHPACGVRNQTISNLDDITELRKQNLTGG